MLQTTVIIEVIIIAQMQMAKYREHGGGGQLQTTAGPVRGDNL